MRLIPHWKEIHDPEELFPSGIFLSTKIVEMVRGTGLEPVTPTVSR